MCVDRCIRTIEGLHVRPTTARRTLRRPDAARAASPRRRACGSAVTMAALGSTPEGRAMLSRLAHGVTAGFVPVVAAARDRCALVADWLTRAGLF